MNQLTERQAKVLDCLRKYGPWAEANPRWIDVNYSTTKRALNALFKKRYVTHIDGVYRAKDQGGVVRVPGFVQHDDKVEVQP